ncbi:MAG TPA: metal ABC transporter permease [Solirubrobacteraceae bacterium]|nr:metal ABC transporter permease [Solirubrobacteraceae bacterium]
MKALADTALLQRALVELVLVGAACGALGVWVVHLRHAYAAESLAHAMLPGLALAALAGVPLLLGAGGGVLGAAALVFLAARDRRIDSQVGVAVVVTALLGLGALLALVPGAPARLEDLLFGDPLGVSPADLAVAGGLVAGVLLALGVAHRRLTLGAFDPVAARALGASPARTELLLLALLAVTIVAAVQGVGNLLVVALLLAPAAAALDLARSLPAQLALGAALGAGSGAGGLVLSLTLDVAAGASVALVAVAIFALSGALAPRHRGAGAARGSAVEAVGGA